MLKSPSISPPVAAEPGALAPCPNCGSPLDAVPQARFCPQCGQETRLPPPTLREFVHEFLTHYGSAGGTLGRTLALLLRRPGELTLEYFRGRRRHYVGPMRLYLTTSFAFFLVVRLFNLVDLGDANTWWTAEDEATEQHATAASGPPAMPPDPCLKAGSGCSWPDRLEAQLRVRAERLNDKGLEVGDHLLASAPYAVFFMLPLFAALMKLLYWRRRRSYGEHLVFSLHLHSTWFLALLAIDLLPGLFAGMAALSIPVYGVMAMRRVHGGSLFMTGLRAFLISSVYSLLLLIAVSIAAVGAAMSR